MEKHSPPHDEYFNMDDKLEEEALNLSTMLNENNTEEQSETMCKEKTTNEIIEEIIEELLDQVLIISEKNTEDYNYDGLIHLQLPFLQIRCTRKVY